MARWCLTAMCVPMLLWTASVLPAQQRRVVSKHYTYVIVHGAWGGGWDWLAIDSMLTGRGHKVVRVTLTGLGERHHLASPNIGLDTHIDDVVNKILWDNLHDIVLVGHSYGGMVITGVVDRVPDRIKAVVYVDAAVPMDGESANDVIGRKPATQPFLNPPGWPYPPTKMPPYIVPMGTKAFSTPVSLKNPEAKHI